MEDEEPWHLTIVLLEGLRHMRPEKTWRPIVTVEVDKHHSHETLLGADGQNVNQKECFKFHEATLSTKLEVNVWHRSQSKKKKRRVLVASASHCLGELLKKQESDSKLEVRLHCRTPDGKSVSSKGRPQNGALLRMKLRAPSTVQPHKHQKEVEARRSADAESSDDEDSASVATEDAGSLIDSSEVPLLPSQQLRRRRPKGYAVYTDDEVCSTDDGYRSDDRLRSEDTSITCIDDEDGKDPFFADLVIHSHSKDIISFSAMGAELAASNLPLPLYTEKITIEPDFNRGERFLASFTLYGEMSQATSEEQLEPVFRRLQYEWTYMGGMLCALAAVNTAVFALSPDSIFLVNIYAKSAIALSSIASGLGVACDAWFLLRYNWLDVHNFTRRSRDVYGTYVFFSLSARMPILCMFISAISLMGFLGLVAFDTWPQAVLLICFVVGIIMTLQFLVYGVHLAAKTVASGGRRAVGLVRRVTR